MAYFSAKILKYLLTNGGGYDILYLTKESEENKMTIIRIIDGKEITIELTDEEVYAAYREEERANLLIDIENYCKIEEIEVTNAEMEEVANVFEQREDSDRTIWENIEAAIEEWKERIS